MKKEYPASELAKILVEANHANKDLTPEEKQKEIGTALYIIILVDLDQKRAEHEMKQDQLQ